jgi:ABC-type sugar transport system permease subunit
MASMALTLPAAREAPNRPFGREAVFYMFALPFAALTILFGLWPILLSIQVSFTASATALRSSPSYIGLANYVAILGDPVFVASLLRTLLYTVLAVTANVGFALLYALLLDSCCSRSRCSSRS